ncbi:MAG: GGDEF domain-containing protein [Hungatella sp.]|nr:GGDEF domain-containing protein [Hungatella sp.]
MSKEGKAQIRGVRIQTLNYLMIFAAVVLYVILIYATYQISVRYDKLMKTTEEYIRCEEKASLIKQGSDYLTEQVRLYVVTMEPEYMNGYFTEKHETKRREKALEDLEDIEVGSQAGEYLRKAIENSQRLEEREIYAMRLVAQAKGEDLSSLPEEIRNVVLLSEHQNLSPEEMAGEARNMVFDHGYQSAKELIVSHTEYYLDSVLEWVGTREREQAAALKSIIGRQRICISILFALNTLTFVLVIVLIVKPLQIYINCIKEEKMLEIAGAYEFKYLALTYNDIYEVNAANEILLRHKAEHDPLTGVINRGAFEQMKELLKASADPLALLIIDVDQFKLINDGYGHEVGDQILKKVAKQLSDSFRSRDYVARIGGDEFAIIMTNCTKGLKMVIKSKADQVNQILQNPTDGLPKTSLSIGVAFSDSGFPEDLYARADSALYKVKENGRCGCDFYGEND